MLNLGYIVVANLPIFRNDIHRWLRRDPSDQTWEDFITFFTVAHQELRETNVSADEIGFQSANTIVTQIVDHLRDEVNNQQSFQETPLEQPVAVHPSVVPQQQVANATQDMIMAALL